MGRNSSSTKKSNNRPTIVAIILGLMFFSLMIVPAFLGRPDSGGVKISKAQHMAHPPIDIKALTIAVNPPNGVTLPVQYGQMGPKLLEAGVIDVSALKQQTGQALTDQDLEILTQGSQEAVVIDQQNASFLLNLFGGLGLANQNPIFDKAPIHEALYWTLGRKPGSDLFSSTAILKLSPDQQARVEEVAKAVYRPCSDAAALSPDNKYSIAMLGLLELMASQNVSSAGMFSAAKQVNAFWFPKQTLEQAIFFVATQLQDYANVDARLIVSRAYFSASGFRQLHQWLKDNAMLGDEPEQEPNCKDD